jgi:hypothetical protein
MGSDVEWTDVIVKWFYFEVIYDEVLGDKSAMCIRVTLYRGYLIILWLFHLGTSCNVFVLTCFVIVWMCVCVGVCMCGCVYVWVFWYYVYFYLLRFVLFVLCFLYCFIYIYLSLSAFCTSVRTTATEWQLNYS